LLGTGRHVVVSPTSSAGAILATAVFPLAGGDPARYAALAAALTVTVGLLFLGASLLKLGAISDFVSKPVLKGFMFGLGMTIAIKQLATLAGIGGIRGDFFVAAWQLLHSLAAVHAGTLVLGATALVFLFAASVRAPQLPGGLLALAAGIAVSWLFGLPQHGVAVVGTIEGGLPRPALP